MTRQILYLSHPEVVIDPAVPIPDWRLSSLGRTRLLAALGRGWPGRGNSGRGWHIVTSPEAKARETAELIADATGDPLRVQPDMGEVDRSATGCLPHDRHEALADALFANPEAGPEGWESASAAQRRIVSVFRRVLAETEGDLLFVGHGAVGSFLRCQLAGLPIARQHDQPRCGCFWTCAIGDVSGVPSVWQSLEEAGASP